MSTNISAPPDHVGQLIEHGAHQFEIAQLYFGHGMQTAFDEAAYLTLYALGLPPDELDPVWERPITTEEYARIQALFARRISERVPSAYLTHEAWLGPYRFYVDERVIVPRSFIAELLHEELAPWVADPITVSSILDLCTGSGCLAILAALTFPQAHVDAVDLSGEALEVAHRNIDDYGLAKQINAIQSDMFNALGNRRYDLIIANPPYVTGPSMRSLPDEYQREPALALASGEDGLDHVRTILAAAPCHLNEQGLLVVEVGFNREGVEQAFPTLPFMWAETSAGDGVVFMLTREELLAATDSP